MKHQSEGPQIKIRYSYRLRDEHVPDTNEVDSQFFFDGKLLIPNFEHEVCKQSLENTKVLRLLGTFQLCYHLRLGSLFCPPGRDVTQ